jgi:putative transposase
MDPDKLAIVETGVLTASGERWSQAEARFGVLAPLLEMHPVRSEAVDAAAQRFPPLSTRTLLCFAWSCNFLGSGPVRFGRTGLARSGSLSGHGTRSAQYRGSDDGMGYLTRYFLHRQKLSVAALQDDRLPPHSLRGHHW